MLKPWVVLYVIAGEDMVPQAFLCQAEDMDHADEQCMDAYPDAHIVWAEEGVDVPRAFENYWYTEGT